MPKESTGAELEQVVIDAIVRSGRPFGEETLERVGELEGSIKRQPDGRLTITLDFMNRVLDAIEENRRRLSRKSLEIPPSSRKDYAKSN
jgi:hypothetical protein